MDALIQLITEPPVCVEELQSQGQELLTEVRRDYMLASQRYSSASKDNTPASFCEEPVHTGCVLLERHLSAEKEMLCSEIVEIDSEEVIEERLARSRKLRLQLRQLRDRKEALQKSCAEKSKVKKLEIKNHKHLREVLNSSSSLTSLAQMEELPCPLYTFCCVLLSAKQWIDFDVQVNPVMDSRPQKRSKPVAEGKGPSIQVTITRKNGERGTWVVRYSLDCKLIFVDTASSDSWVVDILSRIQPHSGSSSQPQLERCCYSKEIGRDSASELPYAWKWLQELGGISEMPLLSGKHLLKGEKTGHVLAVSLLKTLHDP